MSKIWEEFKLIFRNPRQIHRVLAVIPLAALLSHALYLYAATPKGVPVNQDQIITMVLGAISWVFLSGDLDIELAMRFLWCSLLAILAHRVIVMDNEIGGSFYYRLVSLFAIGTLLLFVVTGKTKNELKIWFNVKFDGNKDGKKATIHSITDGTNG
jgi:hypothetical protein